MFYIVTTSPFTISIERQSCILDFRLLGITEAFIRGKFGGFSWLSEDWAGRPVFVRIHLMRRPSVTLMWMRADGCVCGVWRCCANGISGNKRWCWRWDAVNGSPLQSWANWISSTNVGSTALPLRLCGFMPLDTQMGGGEKGEGGVGNKKKQQWDWVGAVWDVWVRTRD